MAQTIFELIREKYKRAQAEKMREIQKERKELANPDELKDRFGSDSETPREIKQQTVKEANKTIQLIEKFKNMLKQTQADEISAKENKEKEYETIRQKLDKVEKAVKQN